MKTTPNLRMKHPRRKAANRATAAPAEDLLKAPRRQSLTATILTIPYRVAAEADQWYLQIASVAHPLPEGFVQPSTTVIDDIGREIDSRIVGAYWDLVNAAKADGLNIYPISGFRPHSTQVSLFNARVEQARNDGYADPEAEAARHVAKPGTSEHELGLAG